jgi:PAS domain S-box-containing protein
MTKTKESEKQLHAEIKALRQKIAELEEENIRHQRVVEAWRDLWAQYEAMIEAFDGYIYICSQNYEVEFMNQRFIERTGFYPLGQKCYKALHDREDICPWCVNERVFRGEKVIWEVQSPKDHRWYRVVNTPIRHADGTVSKMAMVQDITEIKEAEKVRRRAEGEKTGLE